jgi:hypothetical protein
MKHERETMEAVTNARNLAQKISDSEWPLVPRLSRIGHSSGQAAGCGGKLSRFKS